MTTSKAGTSRASSARPTGVLRDIQKRRDKPYKTEQHRILAKKRKLNLHTSYRQAPAGFQFLAVGTPDLAERCKELSRQRGLPVNVVNGQPVSKAAVNPEKVSHHIHRIGYHFRADVVDDACQELGYYLSHGHFLKEADLAAQNEHSRMARAMAKHGLKFTEPARRETDDQVKAAIKELFPKIPEDDLREILKHAWQEGTDRIGNNSNLELPRRVQLAVIARIRHTYTDYDRLLRAFDWTECRSIVEPECLAKLIEWRGEQDEEDDGELEEIVRETIVIDDDDDKPARNVRYGSVADDESSAADLDQEYASDTSLEISHKPAAIEDLGAESHDERSRRFLDRHQPFRRDVQRRHLDVRKKIETARQHMRNGYFSGGGTEANIVRVHVPDSSSGDDTIMIDGRMYRRQLPPPPTPQTVQVQEFPLYQYGPQPLPQGSMHSQEPYSPYSRSPQRRPGTGGTDINTPHNQPVASIEPHDDLRRMVIASSSGHGDMSSNRPHSRATSPIRTSLGKRRRIDEPAAPTGYRTPPSAGRIGGSQTYRHSGPAADLTIHSASPKLGRGRTHLVAVSDPRSPSGVSYQEVPMPDVARTPNQSLPQYQMQDPCRATGTAMRDPDPRYGFVDAQVAPVQYVARPEPGVDRQGGAQVRPQNTYHPYAYTQPQHRVVYVQAPQASPTPQPVHGAPAAVQQLPRQVPMPAQTRSTPQAQVTAVPMGYPPHVAAYAEQPQYYYPR